MSLFAELKRRNVFKVGIAYVVASWLILQLTEVLTELLELETDIGKIVIILLVVGFVPAIIFAWAFELTPEGIKRDHEVDRNESITNKTGRKLDFTIIGMLVLIAGYFIWESRFMDREMGPGPEKGSEPFSAEQSQQVSDVDDEQRALTPPSQPPQPVAEPAPDANSIAVLPFANRSLQEEDSFFTDGIHDDLLTQLAKIRNLKVISRTSVMKYKDTEKTIPEIADELQVSTILEGGVQRAGKRVRINAQLIDVANDQHLWAETFDREMTVENIFDIQSEITRQIVQAVRGEMTEEESLQLARIPTNNLQAYEAYLQALALTNRADYSQENYQEAEVWAKRAVNLDPNFSQVWAILVELHGQAYWIGYDTSEARVKAAEEAVANAIRLAPDDAETIAAEAEYVYRIEQDFPRAVELFKQAHQALPGDVDILHRLAVAQRRTTDVEGGLESLMKVLELDPNHSRSSTTAAQMLLAMGRTEEASRSIERWMVQYPDARDLRIDRVNAYLDSGDMQAARDIVNSMTPWVSSAYWFAVIELPFFERDFELARSIWDLPEVEAMADNRGTVGLREAYRAWAWQLEGNETKARELARETLAVLDALPPIGGYSKGYELLTRAQALAILGESALAIEAANQALAVTPESKDQMFGATFAQLRAQVLGMAGAREEALAEIERLLHTPYKFNKWRLYNDSRWDFFRDDERFNALIRPDGAE
jgi:TolB-like protein/thioredoxin-like negative regulator of GroEL